MTYSEALTEVAIFIVVGAKLAAIQTSDSRFSND